MRQRRAISVSTGISCLALLVAWSVFAPTRAGGTADFVIVTGNSMEPYYQQGDLVIVRRADSYRVGDVVTYRNPEIGPVIHRIVARNGERYIFQGDNNAWRDGYQPTSSELIGREWLRLPRVGSWLAHLRSPSSMALVAGLIGVLSMASVTRGPQRQHTAHRRPVDRALLKDWLGVGLLVAIVAAGALALTFSKPTQRATQAQVEYTQVGRFGYTTPEAAGVGIYDQGVATSGEPIFRQVSDGVALAFSYRISAVGSDPGTFSGTWRLDAELSDVNGWKRTLPLLPETAFTGPAVDATALLTFNDLQAVIDRVERQTGVERAQYSLAIVPYVQVEGTLAGHQVRDAFAPRLEFMLDDLQLQVKAPSESLAATLAPEQTGAVVWPSSTANSLAVLAWHIDVTTARAIALAVFALALIGLAVGWLALTVFSSDGDAAGAVTGDVIEVQTWSDLLELSQRLSAPVESHDTGREKRYVVSGGGLTYAFVERAQKTRPA